MDKKINLETETINGYEVDEKMKRVWNVELDLLEKLLNVCDKYGLKCFADAGTLLGAVRHKGFIPWDDDIDVVMFREDYDKLIEIGEKEFKDPYFLQSTYSDKNYIRGHAQLRNSSTTAILESELSKKLPFNQGIFIDIFVLDAVTDNKFKLGYQKVKSKIMKKILKKYIEGKNDKRFFKGKCVNKILSCYFKFVPYKKFYSRIEDIFRKESISKSQYVAPLNFVFETEKRIRDKNIYNETIMLDFENLKIPAPSRYNEFLTKRYGKDYMIPKKISTTHGGVILDLNKSYKEYLKDEK